MQCLAVYLKDDIVQGKPKMASIPRKSGELLGAFDSRQSLLAMSKKLRTTAVVPACY
jgi:hypothetical protein